jgi:hypothetical protein
LQQPKTNAMDGFEKVILSLKLRQEFYQKKSLAKSIIHSIGCLMHCPALNPDSFNTSQQAECRQFVGEQIYLKEKQTKH